jgi:hypothetical protein
VAKVEIEWPPEQIPVHAKLYMRAHKVFLYNGELAPGVFRDHQGGMSTEWDKYSTPDEVRARCKKPLENGIIEMTAGDVIGIPLTVSHTPDVERRVRGHTDVVGEKTPEVRLKLLRIHRWAIRL